MTVAIVAVGLFSVSAWATPIQPDLKKLLSQPAAEDFHYPPARAGWNGPEVQPPRAQPNPALESLHGIPAANLKAAMLAAITPDPLAVTGLVLLILLLRRLRHHQEQQPNRAPLAFPSAKGTRDLKAA